MPVSGVANPLPPNALPAIYVDFVAMGAVTSEGLLAQAKPDDKLNIVTFPGQPAQAGRNHSTRASRKRLRKTRTPRLREKFGDSGVAVQLQLIQDALQAYPGMNVIWGTAPTAEAAIGAVAEAGRTDMKIMSSYENQAMLDALNRGDVLAFATQYPVGEGAVSGRPGGASHREKAGHEPGTAAGFGGRQDHRAETRMDLVLAPEAGPRSIRSRPNRSRTIEAESGREGDFSPPGSRSEIRSRR